MLFVGAGPICAACGEVQLFRLASNRLQVGVHLEWSKTFCSQLSKTCPYGSRTLNLVIAGSSPRDHMFVSQLEWGTQSHSVEEIAPLGDQNDQAGGPRFLHCALL